MSPRNIYEAIFWVSIVISFLMISMILSGSAVWSWIQEPTTFRSYDAWQSIVTIHENRRKGEKTFPARTRHFAQDLGALPDIFGGLGAYFIGQFSSFVDSPCSYLPRVCFYYQMCTHHLQRA